MRGERHATAEVAGERESVLREKRQSIARETGKRISQVFRALKRRGNVMEREV